MRRALEVNVAETDDRYLAGDEFPVMDGERMCPRCMCCSVRVGSYDPPQLLPGLRFTSFQFVPVATSLHHDPDPSSGSSEAWYCRGGCNDKGEHSKHLKGWPENLPTFIAHVKKIESSVPGEPSVPRP